MEIWFATQAGSIDRMRRDFVVRHTSADQVLDGFRRCDCALHKAFAALGERVTALEADLRALMAAFDTGGGASLRLTSACVEVVIRKSWGGTAFAFL